MVRTAIQLGISWIQNVCRTVDIVYVVDTAAWSIYWDGYYTVTNMPENISAVVRRTAVGARATIIHYGTVDLFLREQHKAAKKAKKIVSWFHVDPAMDLSAVVPIVNQHATLVHTTCEITKEVLVQAGVEGDRIVIVPLGVDIKTFHVLSAEERTLLRKEMGILTDAFVVGSFQKDGVGWGEGNEPKQIKGPDIFCDAIEELVQKGPVHVLLSGPSRGYVKNRLQKAGIPFTHTYVPSYADMNRLYNVLDVYVITSRAEGGPKAILESWATGVPVISSPIGMVKDVSEHERNVLLCADMSPTSFAAAIQRIRVNASLRDTLVAKGLDDVSVFAYEHIAARYWKHLYSMFV